MADILTPIKAIRAKCLDCMGGSPKRVKECEGGGLPSPRLQVRQKSETQGHRRPAGLEEKGDF